MATLWDPRTLLEVDPQSIAPCVATTQKNTRCGQRFFSRSDLSKASHLLNDISLYQPASSRAKLALLAEYMSCPRHHRKSRYIDKVVRDWWAIICASYPNGTVPIAPVVPATTQSRTLRYGSEERDLTRRRNMSQTALPSVATPTPPQSPSPAPRALPVVTLPRALALFRPIVNTTLAAESSANAMTPSASSRSPTTRGLLTPPASSRSPTTRGLFTPPASSRLPTTRGLVTPPASPSPPQSPSLSPSSVEEQVEEEVEEEVEGDAEDEAEDEAEDGSEDGSEDEAEENGTLEEDVHDEDTDEEETPEEEVEERTTPTSPTSGEASSLQTPPTTPRRARSPAATTWLPLTPEPTQTTPCPHSSRRKPLIDDCPICNESMHCLDDAVWCRAQCGQNMHRSCFAPWRTDCLDREAPVTCVYCRAQWKYEWED